MSCTILKILNLIGILFEKNSVLLNADSMDITSDVLKLLDKKLPSLKIDQE